MNGVPGRLPTVQPAPMMRIPFSHDLSAARHVRGALAAIVSAVDDVTAWRIELVLSELVSNVVKHTAAGGVVTVWEVDAAGVLRLEVTDSTQTAPSMAAEPPLVGGRGLRIVEELSVAWGVITSFGGKTVWVDFACDRPLFAGAWSSPFYPRVDPALAVVTTSNGSRPAGCLVAFHTQCGTNPVRYAVWLAKSTETYAHALETDHFAVHFLGEHQGDLAARFGNSSGRHVDKFQDLDWTPGPQGVPLLADCANRAAFRRTQTWDDGGEHTCLIGVPIDDDAYTMTNPVLRRSHVVSAPPMAT